MISLAQISQLWFLWGVHFTIVVVVGAVPAGGFNCAFVEPTSSRSTRSTNLNNWESSSSQQNNILQNQYHCHPPLRRRSFPFIQERSLLRLHATAAKDEEEEVDDDSWISINPDDLTGSAKYQLFISAVVPRPVAVITSQSSNGTMNCAPFSYTSLSSHDPPLVTHGIGIPPPQPNTNGSTMEKKKKKDTLINIEQTHEWVYNVLTTQYVQQANDCSATLPSNVDETKEFGLQTLPSTIVKVPRLAQATVAMECQLYKNPNNNEETKNNNNNDNSSASSSSSSSLLEIYNDDGIHTTTLVIGRVVCIHIHKSVLQQQQSGSSSSSTSSTVETPIIDLLKLQAVGRAGDITYWPHGIVLDDNNHNHTLRVPRPS